MTDGKVASILIASELRYIREKIGITQKELSERANVTQAQISRMENFDNMPRLDILMNIASSLNVTIKIINPFSEEYYTEKLGLLNSAFDSYKREDEDETLYYDVLSECISFDDYKESMLLFDELFDKTQKKLGLEETETLYVIGKLLASFEEELLGEDQEVANYWFLRVCNQYVNDEYLESIGKEELDLGDIYPLIRKTSSLLREITGMLDNFTISKSGGARKSVKYRPVEISEVTTGETVDLLSIDGIKQITYTLADSDEYEVVSDLVQKLYGCIVVTTKEEYFKQMGEVSDKPIELKVSDVKIMNKEAKKLYQEMIKTNKKKGGL